MSATESRSDTRARPGSEARPGTKALPVPPAAPGSDPRQEPPEWSIPREADARRRARWLALISLVLAGWYLGWLVQARRVGAPELFGLLVAAEAFNLLQAIGFWWTCSHQLMRQAPRRIAPDAAVDVMIPVYGEPASVVAATVAAATRMAGAHLRVWLLDDGRSPEMAQLAERHGAEYLTRPDNVGAKAGNLNHALARTDGAFVLVLDCDHVPRPEMLQRTLGYLLEDDRVAYVQTPQYYANKHRGPVPAAAAAQQELFFGPIARGKDGLGAMFCAGTNVVFRRSALLDAGGFPEGSLTEDFQLSIRLHELGWRSVYHPEVVALGLGPEDMASYVSQQQRWARGCLSALPRILTARLPWRMRVQYLLSATYFLSGWTLLLYMSLPVVRILTGLQPLAATTANQFLLHFAPYYCSALAAVAVAGFGSYTFGAFALASGSFWIHVQSTIASLLRLPARFVVTPKHGVQARQPRAVAPALLAMAALVGVALYGLSRDHSAATLNNVAFAALHASVLAVAVTPALRRRHSAPLAPEAPPPTVPLHERAWPRRLTVGAIAACFAVPIALAVTGHRALGPVATLPVQAHADAERFMQRYVSPDGRVVRSDQGGDTVSEGQAYAMLLAVALDDRAGFERVWSWTRAHLRRSDGLLSYHWQDGRVTGAQPAADADLDAARALVLAGRRFGSAAYGQQGEALGQAVLDHETAPVAGRPVLIAGPWAASDPRVTDASYFSPRAYADLDHARPDLRWSGLAETSRVIVGELERSGRELVADWSLLPAGDLRARPAPGPAVASTPGTPPVAPATAASAGKHGRAPVASIDAVRVAVRMDESCLSDDRRMAAAQWPILRHAPGYVGYSLRGRPLTADVHPTSLVAAAAAARAAGNTGASNRLLAAADAADRAHPTYYGAAWTALARVMLTSQALGSCPPASP